MRRLREPSGELRFNRFRRIGAVVAMNGAPSFIGTDRRSKRYRSSRRDDSVRPMVGHYQVSIRGCPLLSDETSSSYSLTLNKDRGRGGLTPPMDTSQRNDANFERGDTLSRETNRLEDPDCCVG